MKRQAEVEDRDVSRLHELDKVALQAMLKPKEKSNK